MVEATFSNGAAQTQPDAPVSANGSNGATTPPQTSPGGTPFLSRVASIPLVNEAGKTAYNVIQSNAYTSAAYNKAEEIANNVYSRVAPPVQNHLGGPISTADGYANRSLDFVEKRVPIAFQSSSDIISQARGSVDKQLGPVTEQFSTQLTQAQSSLHTVQEKLAGVVAGIPRSPKDVQTTVHDVTSSLLQEVEKIQQTITSSAKGLPANVQSAVSPLFDQLSHAVNDIRTELNRSDVPLTTRAANVLNYSRTNTEKALREALDRVSALLRQNKSDAEKTVDQAGDKVTDVANTASKKADEATNGASKKVDEATSTASKKADKAANTASKKVDKAQSEVKKATS